MLKSRPAHNAKRLGFSDRIKASKLGKSFVANPAELSLAKLKLNQILQDVKVQDENEDYRNTMDVLFIVFRESIREQNEDKKYFLRKLTKLNELANGLANYLRGIEEAYAEASRKRSLVEGESQSNCLSSVPNGIIWQIETATVRFEEALMRSKDRQQPDVQEALKRLKHYRKVILEAKSAYKTAYSKAPKR